MLGRPAHPALDGGDQLFLHDVGGGSGAGDQRMLQALEAEQLALGLKASITPNSGEEQQVARLQAHAEELVGGKPPTLGPAAAMSSDVPAASSLSP